jgi:SAM-dependent methyltransferase
MREAGGLPEDQFLHMKWLVLRVASLAEESRLWLLRQKWFTSRLLPAMPRSMRWMLRRIVLAPVDLADRLRGPKRSVMPPRASNFSGAVIDFEESGDTFVGVLSEVAGLTPSSKVLDVGCGMGRLAGAMARFLDRGGSYDGLDIVPEGIAWCRENIASPNGNIRFTLADVYNAEYHPTGSVAAVDFVIPFADQSFDLVVLASVFTHMVPDEVDHYLGEIARLLAPDGRCFASYYLLTRESRARMHSKESVMRFNHDRGSHWIVSAKVPELSVGYDDSFLTDLYAKHGLSGERYLGHWCGQPSHWSRTSNFGEQDVIVARKTLLPHDMAGRSGSALVGG